MGDRTDIAALAAAREWASEHVHPQPDDRMLRAYGAALLRGFADLLDRGPTFPLPPSIFSALARERADDLAGSDTTSSADSADCSDPWHFAPTQPPDRCPVCGDSADPAAEPNHARRPTERNSRG